MMQISVGEYSRWERRQVQRHQGRDELDVPKTQQEGQWAVPAGARRWRWMCFHIPWGPTIPHKCIDFISGGMETDPEYFKQRGDMFYLRDVQNLSGCFQGQDDGSDQPKDMSKAVTENGQIWADFEDELFQGMIGKDNSKGES